jgi:hypothetical protein
MRARPGTEFDTVIAGRLENVAAPVAQGGSGTAVALPFRVGGWGYVATSIPVAAQLRHTIGRAAECTMR